jgi:hypothetical protein
MLTKDESATFHDVEQRTDEWFALRRGRITASQAYALERESSQQTLLAELVREKAGLPKAFQGSEATRYGTDAEPLARAAFAEEFHLPVAEVGFVTLGRLGASPDGVAGGRLLEIKCPYSRAIPDDPYAEHLAQVNFQLGVCGLDSAFLWYWSPEESKAFNLVFDEALWQRQRETAERLLDELDAIEDPQAWLAERELEQRTDSDWLLAEAFYLELKEKAERCTEAAEEARQRLIELAPDGARGELVELKWVDRAGNINWRKLAKDQQLDDELVERYRGEGTRYAKVTVL